MKSVEELSSFYDISGQNGYTLVCNILIMPIYKLLRYHKHPYW